MSSAALRRWRTERSDDLDRIAEAHAAVGGSRRGRRRATAQINQAYATLLSSQFQDFCRDLHSECVDHIARAIQPRGLYSMLHAEFNLARRLDRGNPNAGNIGADFARFGLTFWQEVSKHDARNASRQAKLHELNTWRNAIAHQDFDPHSLRPVSLTLPVVKGWRSSCDALAKSFDVVMAKHIAATVGQSPW